MAIENANFLHAACLFLGADPTPNVIAGFGLRAAAPAVERMSTGLYRVHLAEPIAADLAPANMRGGVLAQIYFGGASNVRSLEALLLDPTGDYVTVTARDITNTVQDNAVIQVLVFRYPTID